MKQKHTYNPERLIYDLKRNKQPFILHKTLYTKKIFSKFGTHIWNQKTDLNFKDLNFIMKVKRHADTLTNIPNFVNRKEIYYINSNPDKNKAGNIYSKDIYEIDLSGAYWELAFKFEFINKEIYEQGLTVKKKVRLIALGNLAKRTAVMEYNGNEFLPITYKEAEKTKNVFFEVAKYTDFIMRRLAIIAGDKYLFYWVDAIFFQGTETLNILVEYLNESAIKFKTIPIKKIHFQKNNTFVQSLEKDIEKKRNFNF